MSLPCSTRRPAALSLRRSFWQVVASVEMRCRLDATSPCVEGVVLVVDVLVAGLLVLPAKVQSNATLYELHSHLMLSRMFE